MISHKLVLLSTFCTLVGCASSESLSSGRHSLPCTSTHVDFPWVAEKRQDVFVHGLSDFVSSGEQESYLAESLGDPDLVDEKEGFWEWSREATRLQLHRDCDGRELPVYMVNRQVIRVRLGVGGCEVRTEKYFGVAELDLPDVSNLKPEVVDVLSCSDFLVEEEK